MGQGIQRIGRGRGGSVRRAERRFIWVVLLPTFLFYLLFRFYPVGYAFYMSLHDWRLLGDQQTFIGLENYGSIFANDLFWKVVGNTFYFALASTLIGSMVALILAILLNPIKLGSSFLRLVYFSPVMTSTIAIATIWLWLYQARFGLFNQILEMAGLPPVPWLISTDWAMPSIIIMSVWGGVGFTMIIFLAGLRGIPAAYYEAASIDGATVLQQARHITVPLLMPVITFVLVTGLIGGFNVFQQVYLLTRGGPQNATRTLALHIYDFAFLRLLMGVAASMAFVMFGLVILMTIAQLRLQRTDWEL